MKVSQYEITKQRTIQWTFILLVLLSGTGGYFYLKSRAAQTNTDNRPSFEAPLTNSLDLTRGTGGPTFSRSDGTDRVATVTDFEGLIKSVKNGEARFEGARRVENLLPNSSFETWSSGLPTSWLKNANATVTQVTGRNGSGSAIQFSATVGGNTGTNRLYTSSQIFVNKGTPQATQKYRISAYVRRTSGSGGIDAGGDSWANQGVPAFTPATNNIWYRTNFNVVSENQDTTSGSAFYFFPGVANDVFEIDDVQVEDVTGQSNQNPSEYISTGVKTAVPYHGANIDGVKYFATQNGNTVASNVVTEATGAAIPDATLHGYLSEGSRTNLFTKSEQVDDASWTKNNVTSTGASIDSIVAPSGQSTADKLVEDSSNTQHWTRKTSSKAASALPYAFSVYLKAGGRTLSEVWLHDGGGNGAYIFVDLTTGSVTGPTLSGTGWSGAIASSEDKGNGWWRVQLSATSNTATSIEARVYTNNGTAGHDGFYTGDGTSGIYIWGAQLESGLFASSYMPTTTASVTRGVDLLSYPTAGNVTGTVGTAYSEFKGGLEDTQVGYGRAIGGGSSDKAVMSRNNGSAISCWDLTTATNYTIAVDPAVTRVKVATRFSSAGKVLSYAGVLSGSSTYNGNFFDTGVVGIGGNTGSGTNNLNGTIKNVRMWNKALTDADLQNITSTTDSIANATTKKSAMSTLDNTGLVGFWSFEDNGGTKATDFSGNGNVGTLNNFALTGTTSNWVNGKIGKALNFDGVDDRASMGASSTLALTDNFTLSAWINPSSLHTTGYFGLKNIFLSRDDGSATTIDYLLQVESDTSITFKKRVSPEGIISYTFSGVPSLTGNWSHILLTVSSGTATLYVNGTMISSQAIATLGYQAGQGLFVGGCGIVGQTETMFAGSLDDIRIYNRVLSQSEITKLYRGTAVAKINTSQNSQSTSGLVGMWSFNGADMLIRSYATWNPSDKGTAITLSGGNLIASASTYTGLVRGTVGKSSGKWYWELTAGAGWPSVGIATASAGLNQFTGYDVYGWSYGFNGKIYHNDPALVGAFYTTPYTAGDIIGVALDMDNGTLTFYKNNVSPGVAYTGLSGTVYPAISSGASGVTGTVNFGATPFTYTPPAGFNAGLYTNIVGAADVSGSGHNGTLMNSPVATEGKSGQALSFNGTNQYVSVGNIGSTVQSVSFWIKADNLTRKIIDLNGTANIEVSGQTIIANGFTSPTIYVDGAVASIIDSGWHFVTITTGTPITASAVDIGRVGASYFDGSLDEVRLYGTAIASSQIANMYSTGGAVSTSILPAVISAISSGTPTVSSTTVTWTTSVVSTSYVDYGTTTAYGSTAGSATYTTSNSVALSGLADGTTYHFRVRSTNAAGNETVSGDGTFTTVVNPWQNVAACRVGGGGTGNTMLVYKSDLAELYWETSYTSCASPQCSGGVLVADNAVDFSAYPARNACKGIGGRLPTKAELACIYNNKASYTALLAGWYQSATESTNVYVWTMYFADGTQTPDSKQGWHKTRCVQGT